MPFLSPPAHGFIGLLTGADNFEQHLKSTAIHAMARLGLFPTFDSQRIEVTLQLWRDCYVRWQYKPEPPEKVSHIKMAGALLWAFIQEDAAPVDDVVVLERGHRRTLEAFGASDRVVDFKKGRGEIFQASPNPAIGYLFVTAVFNTIQRARGITRAGVDFNTPPLTKHYFQNLACWYLVDCDPSPDDLYMLFKTMDLYALNHPVSD
jgi:hypothetical protein